MTVSGFKQVDWIATTNVYEVNVRQYTNEGTFRAFANELPRLKAMGVETLWFMPVTPIAQKNKKGSLGSPYACSDYRAVNPEFGTAEDFKQLVSQAHVMGFKVIMDWVANHTGWDHVWTISHPDYYLIDPATNDFKMASGMEDIIELDYSNPALRKAMTDAMEHWVSAFDIDGFRCDLAFWVRLDFWKEARTALEKNKTLFWLGELDPIDNPDYFEVFDAAYTWTWMHKTEDFYKGKIGFDELQSVLMRYQDVCSAGNIAVWFTTNHDENSWNGTEFEKYGDMAGSLAVFDFTWDGMPLLYSGQELPNRKRLEFFEKDPIAWDGSYQLQDFYRTLLLLKKKHPALRAGDKKNSPYLIKRLAYKNCFGYIRENEGHSVLVILNWSNESVVIPAEDERLYGNYLDVYKRETVLLKAGSVLEMGPWGYLVYESIPAI